MSVIRGEYPKRLAQLTAEGVLLPHEGDSGERTLFLSQEEYDEAYQKGIAEGHRLGYQQAKSELDALFNLFQTIIQKTLEQKRQLLDQMKPEVIEFAMQVCEQVIRKELSQPQALVKLIHSLLSSSPSLQQEAISLYLSPEDLYRVEAYLETTEITPLQRVRFLKDTLILQGDFRIETKPFLLYFNVSRELAHLRTKIAEQVLTR